MKFCPKCGSMMRPQDGFYVCVGCGYKEEIESVTTIREKAEDKTIVVVEEDIATLPTTKIECPKCGNDTAYWRMEQTRAADEPTTRIYTCTKCKYTWREY